jgi:hypothetical protein
MHLPGKMRAIQSIMVRSLTGLLFLEYDIHGEIVVEKE